MIAIPDVFEEEEEASSKSEQNTFGQDVGDTAREGSTSQSRKGGMKQVQIQTGRQQHKSKGLSKLEGELAGTRRKESASDRDRHTEERASSQLQEDLTQRRATTRKEKPRSFFVLMVQCLHQYTPSTPPS